MNPHLEMAIYFGKLWHVIKRLELQFIIRGWNIKQQKVGDRKQQQLQRSIKALAMYGIQHTKYALFLKNGMINCALILYKR